VGLGLVRWGPRARKLSLNGIPPTSCPRWLLNTTCGAPSSRWSRRNDCARVCAWSLRSWWVPPVSDRAVRLQLMRAERAIRGAWLRGSISTGGGRGEFLPQHLAPVVFVSFASDPEQCAPLCLLLALASRSALLLRSTWLPRSPSL
jgi:hypothetical protein